VAQGQSRIRFWLPLRIEIPQLTGGSALKRTEEKVCGIRNPPLFHVMLTGFSLFPVSSCRVSTGSPQYAIALGWRWWRCGMGCVMIAHAKILVAASVL